MGGQLVRPGPFPVDDARRRAPSPGRRARRRGRSRRVPSRSRRDVRPRRRACNRLRSRSTAARLRVVRARMSTRRSTHRRSSTSSTTANSPTVSPATPGIARSTTNGWWPTYPSIRRNGRYRVKSPTAGLAANTESVRPSRCWRRPARRVGSLAIATGGRPDGPRGTIAVRVLLTRTGRLPPSTPRCRRSGSVPGAQAWPRGAGATGSRRAATPRGLHAARFPRSP
jgi:hypothetical protein